MTKAKESPVQPFSVTSPIPVSIAEPLITDSYGPAEILESFDLSTPGIPQALISATPPSGYFWKLRRVIVVSRAYAAFEMRKNGNIIETGKTGPAEPTVNIKIDPWIQLNFGDILNLDYDQPNGPPLDVTARIFYTSHIAT